MFYLFIAQTVEQKTEGKQGKYEDVSLVKGRFQMFYWKTSIFKNLHDKIQR